MSCTISNCPSSHAIAKHVSPSRRVLPSISRLGQSDFLISSATGSAATTSTSRAATANILPSLVRRRPCGSFHGAVEIDLSSLMRGGVRVKIRVMGFSGESGPLNTFSSLSGEYTKYEQSSSVTACKRSFPQLNVDDSPQNVQRSIVT
jgi:hypothetical protein